MAREVAAFLLGELGQVEGAIEVVGLVLDDWRKSEFATSWASRGLFEQAMKVAERIEDAVRRAGALRAIAEGMAEVREVERAVGIVERETGLRVDMLPNVLPILVERARGGDGKSKKGFLRLLPLCG